MHRRAHGGGDVQAFVHHPLAGVGVEADREVGGDPSADRPDRRRGGEQRLLVLEIALQGAGFLLLRLHLLAQVVELLEQIALVRTRGRVAVGDHAALAPASRGLGDADRAHAGLRGLGGDPAADELRRAATGRLGRGDAELAVRVVELGDVAEVRVEPLDAVQLVVDVCELLLGLPPAVLQLEVLGAQDLVLRHLADHVEVVRHGAGEGGEDQPGAEDGADEHPVLDADLLHLRIAIRNDQDRVRLVQPPSSDSPAPNPPPAQPLPAVPTTWARHARWALGRPPARLRPVSDSRRKGQLPVPARVGANRALAEDFPPRGTSARIAPAAPTPSDG